jgi:hypothetical protein
MFYVIPFLTELPHRDRVDGTALRLWLDCGMHWNVECREGPCRRRSTTSTSVARATVRGFILLHSLPYYCLLLYFPICLSVSNFPLDYMFRSSAPIFAYPIATVSLNGFIARHQLRIPRHSKLEFLTLLTVIGELPNTHVACITLCVPFNLCLLISIILPVR